jgi:hypothetical protein
LTKKIALIFWYRGKSSEKGIVFGIDQKSMVFGNLSFPAPDVLMPCTTTMLQLTQDWNRNVFAFRTAVFEMTFFDSKKN